MSRRRVLGALVLVALCLIGLSYVGAGIIDPPTDGRTLAISVVVRGQPDEVRVALTDRSDLGFEQLSESEWAADNDSYRVRIRESDFDWNDATGSERYTYIRTEGGGAWLEESCQLHEGSYLGERHHIRAYEDPDNGYTAIQAHREYFDFFQLRHNAVDLAGSSACLGLGVSSPPALAALSNHSSRISSRGHGRTGPGLPSPQVFVGIVYPLLAFGPPLAVLALGRQLDPLPAFGFAVFGLIAAFLLDTIWVGLGVIPVQVFLHRFGLALTLGIIALGVARVVRWSRVATSRTGISALPAGYSESPDAFYRLRVSVTVMSDSLAGTDEIVYEPSEAFVEGANVSQFMAEHGIEDFEELHRRSTTEIDGVEASGLEWFWDEIIDTLGLEFDEPYDTVKDDSGARRAPDNASGGPQFTDWYVGGKLNIAHNVVDRHADPESETRNKVATIWEGEDGDVREVTYHELHRQANQVANTLEARGIETGDTVGLYMPMVPEVVSLLYGCFKVGAVAVPIFSGFGVDATATRIADAECSVLFTGDGFYRRGDEVTLKAQADEAIDEAGYVEDVIVYDRLGADIPMTESRDEYWHETVGKAEDSYETKSLSSDQESMLLYSSGTTGKPKGIVHTHAGGLVQPAKELYFSFDHQPSDRFLWVSDIGWMMGPWTLIGNHVFGGTIFMYEGAPDYPNPDRYWQMIDRHNISAFGVSPTAIRALRKHGDEWLEGHDLSTLRLLGSTGEPWDPESWQWFYERVGNGETPIMNISGGTEIFGCFLQPLPTHSLKPGTLGGPALGMDVDIVDASGKSIADEHEQGYLVCRSSAPSMTKSLWSGDERYLEEYWSRFGNLWDHGDWAEKDEDGFWFLQGRSDDVLNVAGRKVGPAEVEGALIDHESVNAAAVIGAEDETTGTAVVAYVILESGHEETDDLRAELTAHVGEELGKPFRPSELYFVDEFPKTQSGKIVRRLIQAVHEDEEMGDLSSIENPDALNEIDEAR